MQGRYAQANSTPLVQAAPIERHAIAGLWGVETRSLTPAIGTGPEPRELGRQEDVQSWFGIDEELPSNHGRRFGPSSAHNLYYVKCVIRIDASGPLACRLSPTGLA